EIVGSEWEVGVRHWGGAWRVGVGGYRAVARAAAGERARETLTIREIARSCREQRVARLDQRGVRRSELVRGDQISLHPVARLIEGEARAGAQRVAQQARVALPQHGRPDFAGVVNLGVGRSVRSEG